MSEKDEEVIDSQDDTTEEVAKTAEESKDETEQEFTDSEKKLFARAKKAEAEAKEAKKKLAEAELNKTNQSSSANSDELRLIAKGFSDEAIEQASAIAKGKGISLNEAIKDPLFIAYQASVKEQEKKDKAKLGAARGSSQVEETKIKPDMSRDEHKEAWKAAMGR